jgi:hypothetical protein
MTAVPKLRLDLDDPTVLLFGAGASRGGLQANRLPPPVDRDFFYVANQLTGHGTPTLAKRVLRSVWELYNRVEGVGLEEYFREIETRAAISQIAKSKNKPKDWSRRQKDLEELIRRVYVQTTVDLSPAGPRPRTSSAHQAILEALTPGSTIVTFNYDLVIEEAFKSAAMWNPHDGYGTKLAGATLEWARLWLERRSASHTQKSKVLLLKLHGSLGWVSYKNGVVKLKGRPYYVRKKTYESISVLPPGWNKKIHVNPYKGFWREARLRLEKCKSLMIVGYSLPETDLLAKALFSEVIRMRAVRHSYLKRLVLVDPDSDVRAKFVRLFTPAVGPLGRIVQFTDINNIPGIGDAA